jgi:hypothetical protein
MVNFDRIEGWLSASNIGSGDDEQELKDPGTVVGSLFEKRIGAACSSLFVAALLDVARTVTRGNISSCDAIGLYTNSLLESVPVLFFLCTRMASLQAIEASNVVHQVGQNYLDFCIKIPQQFFTYRYQCCFKLYSYEDYCGW